MWKTYRARRCIGHRVMSRTIVIYLVLALVFTLLLVWLLVRFLRCCCSPIDADFCQFGIWF
jgi:flagellar biogenesis protein FliO